MGTHRANSNCRGSGFRVWGGLLRTEDSTDEPETPKSLKPKDLKLKHLNPNYSALQP